DALLDAEAERVLYFSEWRPPDDVVSEWALHDAADAARLELPRGRFECGHEVTGRGDAQRAALHVAAIVLRILLRQLAKPGARGARPRQHLLGLFALLRIDRSSGVWSNLNQDVLEHAQLPRLVGRIQLLRREIVMRGEPLVKALPFDLRDDRPHRGDRHRGVVQVLSGGQRLGEPRVIDPAVRHAIEGAGFQGNLFAATRPRGEPLDAQGLIIRAGDDLRSWCKRVAHRSAPD